MLEGFLSEPILSMFRFSPKIRLETPKVVFREKRLHKRMVRNALPNATSNSVDSSTRLGNRVVLSRLTRLKNRPTDLLGSREVSYVSHFFSNLERGRK